MPPHMRLSFTAIAAIAAVTLTIGTGCEGDTGPAGPQGPPGESDELDPSLNTLDKALAGIGGQAALDELASLSFTATGARSMAGEGYVATDDAFIVSTFTVDVIIDIANDRLRLDYVRDIPLFGATTTFSEIVDGNLGYIDGAENVAGFPSGDMLSDRWASIRKQQRLLNPHLILREVVADPSISAEGAVELLDGTLVESLVIDDDVSAMTVFVNARTGRIEKLVALENDHLHRDSEIEVFYLGWQPVGDSDLELPTRVIIALGGNVLHEESRMQLRINPDTDPTLFDFPADAAPVFDADDADRGERSHQFHQQFAGLGIPFDGLQAEVVADELAPGVYYLTGGSHHSLAIEQENGIVIAEAPLYPERSEAILDWVAAEFPDKSVTHVIATHHHQDHTAGLRAFVAAGAAVVLSAQSVDFFRAVFSASSTIVPDALHSAPVIPRFESVSRYESLTLADSQQPVAAHHIETTHSNDMLVVHIPGPDLVFSSDLFSPGLGDVNPVAVRELYDAIVAADLDVTTYLGGHGTRTVPFSELEDIATGE